MGKNPVFKNNIGKRANSDLVIPEYFFGGFENFNNLLKRLSNLLKRLNIGL